MNHFKKYAKMYAAVGGVLVAGTFAADVSNIIIWLLPTDVPPVIQTSIRNLIMAVVGGGAAGLTGNTEPAGLQLPKA